MKHWEITREDNGIAVAQLNQADSNTNTLGREVMQELEQLLDTLDSNPPAGLIVRSGKAAGFIAGANIEEFGELTNVEQSRELIASGWDLFNRLAAVPYPTLALVRGHCLGGGLELALACRYLVTVNEPGTRLGLPEVMLGIFPGWGGMLRLPQRIGPAAALGLMLTGRTLDAKKAYKLGLADACVPPRVMDKAAYQMLLSDVPRRRLSLLQRLQAGPLKGMVASGAKKQLKSKVSPEHYPAPYAIVDLWQHHAGNALQAPEIFERIIQSATTKNLMRVFGLRERLKGFGKKSAFKAEHMHVVGAGVMGGDIAAWCVLRGLTVTLQDQAVERIAPAVGRAHKLFKKKLRDPLLVRDAMDRLIPDPQGLGVARADVVLEAIFENVQAKHALLQNLEPKLKPQAVLATNTSSLRLEDISSALQTPSRLVGIHFFNPVAQMPLVEVVQAPNTEAAEFEKACAFVKQIDKLPLPVQSAPGFLVNAVLGPYLLSAMQAVDEGIAPETIDQAMLRFGMPMGPIELADTVGLDIAMAVGQQLAPQGQSDAAPKCLSEHFEQGQLGKKSGQGFYVWKNGKPQKGKAGEAPVGLAERLIAPLIESTQKLVDSGVVADADLADAGVIFGTGFAPFTGGPLRYQSERV